MMIIPRINKLTCHQTSLPSCHAVSSLLTAESFAYVKHVPVTWCITVPMIFHSSVIMPWKEEIILWNWIYISTWRKTFLSYRQMHGVLERGGGNYQLQTLPWAHVPMHHQQFPWVWSLLNLDEHHLLSTQNWADSPRFAATAPLLKTQQTLPAHKKCEISIL